MYSCLKLPHSNWERLHSVGDNCPFYICYRSELQKYFHEIYFLPDLPELADATAVLKHYTDDPSRCVLLVALGLLLLPCASCHLVVLGSLTLSLP